MKLLFNVFMLLLIFLTGCDSSDSDDDKVIPEASQASWTKDNYGKVKVDGVNFATFDPRSNVTTISNTFYEDQKQAVFRFEMGEAGAQNGKRAFFSIRVIFTGKGTYQILPAPNNDYITYSYYGANTSIEMTSSKGTGTLEITDYDSKKSVSGKFNFVITSDNNKTAKLEAGEFKMPATF